MKRIGITGGIGSGKSVVSQLLRVMGYPVYDTDAEARRLMENSDEIRRQVTDAFGNDTYVDGRLNRPLLAQRAFGNSEQIARLNAIVHPAVGRDFERWSREQGGELCFVESAILYESQLNRLVDSVWWVTAPRALRVHRVKQRSRLSDKEIDARMAAQMSDADLRECVTSIIDNDNTTSVIRSVLSLLSREI